jgi:hypothetical protein
MMLSIWIGKEIDEWKFISSLNCIRRTCMLIGRYNYIVCLEFKPGSCFTGQSICKPHSQDIANRSVTFFHQFEQTC